MSFYHIYPSSSLSHKLKFAPLSLTLAIMLVLSPVARLSVNAIEVDITPPGSPTLFNPVNNAFVHGNSVTQSWSAPSVDVDYYVYESFYDAGATQLRWSQIYYATSKSAINVADTEYWWRVKAVDTAGNPSPWSSLWKITVDSTAPVVTVTGPDQPVVGAPVIPATVATDSSLPLTYTWAAVEPANQALLSDASIAEPTITPTVAGTYDFVLTVTDAAGNTASADLAIVWEQPPTAPAKPTDPIIPPAEVNPDSDVAGASTTAPTPSSNPTRTNANTEPSSIDEEPEAEDVSVLSAADETVSDSPEDKSVKLVASTGADVNSNNAFFGSVWSWALLGLAAFGLLWFILFRRRNDES